MFFINITYFSSLFLKLMEVLHLTLNILVIFSDLQVQRTKLDY